MPGGGALEPGLDFRPTRTPQAGAGKGGRGSGPGRRCGRAGRARGDEGAADLGPSLGADRGISDLRGFGRGMGGKEDGWEGNPLNATSRESEGAARISRPFPPPAENGGERWEG